MVVDSGVLVDVFVGVSVGVLVGVLVGTSVGVGEDVAPCITKVVDVVAVAPLDAVAVAYKV